MTAHTRSASKDACILQDPFAQKEEYKDSWFDKFMVDYFAKQMSKQLGGRLQVQFSIFLNTTRPVGLMTLMVALRKDQITSTYAGKPYRPGYDGFVDLSKEIMKGRSSKQQQQTVAGVLGGLMPPEASVRFRKWFPVSKVNLLCERVAFVLLLVALLRLLHSVLSCHAPQRHVTWRSGSSLCCCPSAR